MDIKKAQEEYLDTFIKANYNSNIIDPNSRVMVSKFSGLYQSPLSIIESAKSIAEDKKLNLSMDSESFLNKVLNPDQKETLRIM